MPSFPNAALAKQPGPNPRFTLGGFTVRRMTVDDLPTIEEIGGAHDFQVGLHNLKLYFSQSPEGWHVAVDDATNKIVAFDSYVRVPSVTPPVYHGYQLVVIDGYLGRGLTKLFATMHYSDYPSMGNSTADSVKRYNLGQYEQKLKGFSFKFETLPSMCSEFALRKGDRIVEVSSLSIVLNDVWPFDKAVSGLDRLSFLLEYVVDAQFSKSLISYDARGSVSGYGTMRFFGEPESEYRYFCLAPLYANDETTAMNLLIALLKTVPRAEYVYFMTAATNRTMLRFAQNAGMESVSNEIRAHNVQAQQLISHRLDWSTAFAVYECFPI